MTLLLPINGVSQRVYVAEKWPVVYYATLNDIKDIDDDDKNYLRNESEGGTMNPIDGHKI